MSVCLLCWCCQAEGLVSKHSYCIAPPLPHWEGLVECPAKDLSGLVLQWHNFWPMLEWNDSFSQKMRFLTLNKWEIRLSRSSSECLCLLWICLRLIRWQRSLWCSPKPPLPFCRDVSWENSWSRTLLFGGAQQIKPPWPFHLCIHRIT